MDMGPTWATIFPVEGVYDSRSQENVAVLPELAKHMSYPLALVTAPPLAVVRRAPQVPERVTV